MKNFFIVNPLKMTNWEKNVYCVSGKYFKKKAYASFRKWALYDKFQVASKEIVPSLTYNEINTAYLLDWWRVQSMI